VTTICRLVTQDSIDESVAEMQRRKHHQRLHASTTSSNLSSPSGSDCFVDHNELLSAAIRAEIRRHCLPSKDMTAQ
jgi:hypothetical protein